MPLGLVGAAVVSQAPSSQDPLEVSSLPFCLGTCGIGSASTGREGRAEFSPVLIKVWTHLMEQSLASPRTVPSADAWSLLAVRHLRGKHVPPWCGSAPAEAGVSISLPVHSEGRGLRS